MKVNHTTTTLTLTNNMSITELKDELTVIVKVADKIKNVHGKVAEKCGISSVYSQKIRNENGAKQDTKENRNLVNKMIKYYRKELEQYARTIETITSN